MSSQAGARTSPVFGGIPTFLGTRIADIEQIGPATIALVGLFLDHGGRAAFGSRFAARQIRYASTDITTRLAPETLDRCVDLGDLNVFPLEPERQEAAFRRQIGAIASTGAVPVLIGGRPLDAPLGTYAGLENTMTLNEAAVPTRFTTPAALQIDLAKAMSWKAQPGAFGRLAGAISGLPADKIGAVHLAGIAPELDVDGRRISTFAAELLATTVQMLAGACTCR